SAGAVSFTVPNFNGGGGNKFTSKNLVVQGAYNYTSNVLYVSLDVPDITHMSASGGKIDFYLTLTGVTSPFGPMAVKYDLSGFNAAPHSTGSFDNSSQGWLYYSSTNSNNPITNPGTAIVTTPVIASNFTSTPQCQLASPGSLSYSCEYIEPLTLT